MIPLRLRDGAAMLFAATVLLGLAPADPPLTLRYQARVLGGAGEPVNETLDVVVRLYDAPTGGVPLYEEFHTKVAPSPGLGQVEVTQGLLSLTVGEGQPLDPADLEGPGTLYLGVTLRDDDELVPRLSLASAPFALRAASAEDVPDKDITPASITFADGTSLSTAARTQVFEAPLLTDSLTTSATWTTVRQVTVNNAPADGQVHLVGTVSVQFPTSASLNKVAELGLTEVGGTTPPADHARAYSKHPVDPDAGAITTPMTVQDVIDIGEGETRTYYLKIIHGAGSQTGTILFGRLVATYVPD